MSAGKLAQKRIRAARKAVERAEQAHRNAFRKACVALFNEYRMRIVAEGDEGARLRIDEMRDGEDYPITELPE
jgi:hypothetical protein